MVNIWENVLFIRLRVRGKKPHLVYGYAISSLTKCFTPGQVSQKHKAIIQLIAASIISLPTMVKRCDFTSKQEEKA